MSKKPFTILFPEDCTELTGIRRCDWKSRVTDLIVNVPFTPGDVPKMQGCTVFFSWSSSDSFVSLQPKVASDLHKSGDDARTVAVELYKKGGTTGLRSARMADNWFAYRFSAASKNDSNKDGVREVGITINIDTGHELFRERVETSASPLVTVDIDIDIGGAKANSNTVELQHGKVVLKLTIPLRRLEPYDGVVAIDFGNTNSTLVACDDKDGVTFIPCDYGIIESGHPLTSAPPDPVPTVLELLMYKPPAEPGRPSEYSVHYGHKALDTEQPARLITGAKRMLADMPESKSDHRTLRVLVGDEPVPVPVPAHEPAEIFISRMFDAFLHFVRKEPKRVAITCPSTFSETEANRVRIATVNGLRRALRRYDRLLAPERKISDAAATNTVKPCLDESTAAAFWFIHEEVLERRGRGAIEFQYLYPQGMNVLIYDCGGGTTDISLVKVGYEKETTRLKIDVLGRRGHRTFGGDYITLQYAKYLKFQMYAMANGKTDDDELSRFIADTTGRNDSTLVTAVNEVLPTLFDRNAPRVGLAADARDRAWALWNLAERLKCLGFEADETNENATTGREDAFESFFNRLDQIEPPAAQGSDHKRLRAKLGDNGFEINKEHVRHILAPVLDDTIRYANELINGRLPKGEEVHRVYLVGNASRFPIISERMLDAGHGLGVRFLAEKLVQGGPSSNGGTRPAMSYEDLKNCVAKGAAVAISLQSQQKAIADWDEDVMKKLPYSIEYQDPARAYPRVLFDCGTLLEASKEANETIHIYANANGRVLADRIRLSRRWPGAGDQELEEFVIFRFKDPLVEGRYKVSYDGEGGFKVSCLEKSHKHLAAKGEPILFPPTVPPRESGEF